MVRLARLIASVYIAIGLIALGYTAFVGPVGYAPFPLPIGPTRQPIVITVWYGTEKEAWLQEAKTCFEATSPSYQGRPIQIELKGLGSREIAERIAQQQWNGDPPPTAISPASSLWLDLLGNEWPARHGADIIGKGDDAPVPLVLTPLVVAGWQDRANVLWPQGPQHLWRDIHDALADSRGWAGHGGSPNWGFVI